MNSISQLPFFRESLPKHRPAPAYWWVRNRPPPERAFIYRGLAEHLASDATWSGITNGASEAQSTFAYCTLNGMDGLEALRLIYGNNRIARAGPDVRTRLLARFQRTISPIYSLALLSYGVSPFYLVSKLREIIDSKAHPNARLRAIELAADLTGMRSGGTIIRTQEVTRVVGDEERTVRREEISRQIQQRYGDLLPMPRSPSLPTPTAAEETASEAPLLLRMPKVI